MTNDPIVYRDNPGQRVLDLRTRGIDCIPVLGLSDFSMLHPGTDYHIHPNDVEICLCVRGNLTFETEERSYPFLPGSLFVSTDRQPHRMRHNPKGLLTMRVLFRIPRPGKRILGLTVKETQWITRSLLHLPKRLFKSTTRVQNAFASLFSIYDSERLSTACSIKLKAAVLGLLIGVIEAARLLPMSIPDKISGIMKTMREHPDRDYPLERLAAMAGLSKSAFSETFKRSAGLPPHAYLISCRIARAQKMLAAGTQNTTVIAAKLCFCTVQHFSNVFKRVVGMTPRLYANTIGTGKTRRCSAQRRRAT